jgi:hypothetical protein
LGFFFNPLYIFRELKRRGFQDGEVVGDQQYLRQVKKEGSSIQEDFTLKGAGDLGKFGEISKRIGLLSNSP